MSDIDIDEIIKAMRRAGGWYLRVRNGVLPRLWRMSERNPVAPAMQSDVAQFIRDTFPGSGIDYLEAKSYGEAVLGELRHNCHGLPRIDDAVLRLIK